MHYGIVFPQTEIGAGPESVRQYAQGVEELGFDGLMIYDHVLGADVSHRPDWNGWYDHEDMFHEVMVVLGFIAAVTQRIKLLTSIVIAPQRQTALMAKQAAEVDVLSNGRLILGIGVGWNPVEFEALGENFGNRGKRRPVNDDVARITGIYDAIGNIRDARFSIVCATNGN